MVVLYSSGSAADGCIIFEGFDACESFPKYAPVLKFSRLNGSGITLKLS
jgi:hypothetical protein